MNYFLAPSLVLLRDEANNAFQNRDKSSDGWIGDPSHSARKSDHNPDWTAPGRRRGIVRAIDIDVDDNSPNGDIRRMLLDATIGDPRVYYVISNQIIYSRTYGWKAKRYTGVNGHFAHVHVSILASEHSEFNRESWFARNKVRVSPGAVNFENTRDEFKKVVMGKKNTRRLRGVRRIQTALNNVYGLDLKPDGLVGPKTVEGWRVHERAEGGTGRVGVPDRKSMASLEKKSDAITRVTRRK